VHGDFNEFNLMIDADEKITLIDFPQLVHMTAANAQEYFERDVLGVREFFRKRLNIQVEDWPTWEEVVASNLEAKESGDAGVLAAVEGLNADDDAMLVAAHQGAGQEDLDGAAICEGNDDDRSGASDSDSDDAEDDDVVDTAGDRLPSCTGQGQDEDFRPILSENCTAGDDEEQALLLQAPEERTALPKDSEGCPRRVAERDQEVNGANNNSASSSEEDDAGGEGDESEQSDVEEDEAVGQVTAPSTKRVRRKHNAKEARKNLQKQQKQRPAKANNQKCKELRKAKHEIKEWCS